MKAGERIIGSLLVLLFSLGSAGGQEIAKLRVIDVRGGDPGTVQVFAAVTDAAGRRIDGLNTANFKAIVGGKQIAAKSVDRTREGGGPMSVVLLLDTSGSMNRAFADLREAASAFIRQLGPEDTCSIMTFGNGVKTINGFTTDKVRLLELLNSLTAREAKTYLLPGDRRCSK